MQKKELIGTVRAWVDEIVAETTLELVDVEFVKLPSGWKLRVFIDKPDGIDIEDCRLVSKQLEKLLDAEDPIPEAYSLEVSSPGVERPLRTEKDFQRFAGSKVHVKTYAAICGRKQFDGLLLGCQAQVIQLQLQSETVAVPLEQVAKAHLVFEW